jgi:phosphoribosyl 1,2-cyclic phosphodiesterase|nr:MAG TPA: YycJ-like MBL-fold protein [Caudoviricetes sp.]
MKLKVLGSGSAGNCYLLTAKNGETLIIDCGVPIFNIKRGLNFNIKTAAGCIVSHEHTDHCKAKEGVKALGIPLWLPFEEEKPKTKQFGSFFIQCFPLPHNGTKNYGFFIKADEQKILYLTDFEYCRYNFKKQAVNHIIIECNYIKDMLNENMANFEHKVRGHCELETVKQFIKANKTDALQTVVVCHLGIETTDEERIINELKNEVNFYTEVCCANLGLNLELPDTRCPF